MDYQSANQISTAIRSAGESIGNGIFYGLIVIAFAIGISSFNPGVSVEVQQDHRQPQEPRDAGE